MWRLLSPQKKKKKGKAKEIHLSIWRCRSAPQETTGKCRLKTLPPTPSLKGFRSMAISTQMKGPIMWGWSYRSLDSV